MVFDLSLKDAVHGCLALFDPASMGTVGERGPGWERSIHDELRITDVGAFIKDPAITAAQRERRRALAFVANYGRGCLHVATEYGGGPDAGGSDAVPRQLQRQPRHGRGDGCGGLVLFTACADEYAEETRPNASKGVLLSPEEMTKRTGHIRVPYCTRCGQCDKPLTGYPPSGDPGQLRPVKERDGSEYNWVRYPRCGDTHSKFITSNWLEMMAQCNCGRVYRIHISRQVCGGSDGMIGEAIATSWSVR